MFQDMVLVWQLLRLTENITNTQTTLIIKECNIFFLLLDTKLLFYC